MHVIEIWVFGWLIFSKITYLTYFMLRLKKCLLRNSDHITLKVIGLSVSVNFCVALVVPKVVCNSMLDSKSNKTLSNFGSTLVSSISLSCVDLTEKGDNQYQIGAAEDWQIFLTFAIFMEWNITLVLILSGSQDNTIMDFS